MMYSIYFCAKQFSNKSKQLPIRFEINTSSKKTLNFFNKNDKRFNANYATKHLFTMLSLPRGKPIKTIEHKTS